MRSVTRRSVLATGAAGAGALAVGSILGAGPADAAPDAVVTTVIRRHDYQPFVGTSFTATRAGHTHRLMLKSIRDALPATAAQRDHRFVLVFTPLAGARLHDGVYSLRRSGVPTRELFLSALGTAGAVQAVVYR